eukprot:Rhum_TRINITY_DN16478_c0_g1::Rhum_TRINITY_DN16478_c0_g1_i1::g.163302::m.163302
METARRTLPNKTPIDTASESSGITRKTCVDVRVDIVCGCNVCWGMVFGCTGHLWNCVAGDTHLESCLPADRAAELRAEVSHGNACCPIGADGKDFDGVIRPRAQRTHSHVDLILAGVVWPQGQGTLRSRRVHITPVEHTGRLLAVQHGSGHDLLRMRVLLRFSDARVGPFHINVALVLCQPSVKVSQAFLPLHSFVGTLKACGTDAQRAHVVIHTDARKQHGDLAREKRTRRQRQPAHEFGSEWLLPLDPAVAGVAHQSKFVLETQDVVLGLHAGGVVPPHSVHSTHEQLLQDLHFRTPAAAGGNVCVLHVLRR